MHVPDACRQAGDEVIEFVHTDPLGRTKPLRDVLDARATAIDGMPFLHGPVAGWVRESSCVIL